MTVFQALPLPPISAAAFAEAVQARAREGMNTRDAAIAALWGLGFDTYDIAKRLMFRESMFANRLAVIRDGAR